MCVHRVHCPDRKPSRVPAIAHTARLWRFALRLPPASRLEQRHSRWAGIWPIVALDDVPQDFAERIVVRLVFLVELEHLRFARATACNRILLGERVAWREQIVGP